MAADAGSASAALRPESVRQAAGALAELSRGERAVRVVGARTKLDWSAPAGAAREQIELRTDALCRVISHDRGDFTAVLQAGAKLSEAQAAFGEAGQRLALDPPLGAGQAASIGGVLATADSGPSRHRYGAPRDLVIGITVALSDGTLAKAGGKVIKNVAGYDLGKLFVGSHGTLGLIAEVCVRLHPCAQSTATLLGETADADALARAAASLARLPLEAECLDAAWVGERGRVLVRFAGPAASERARAAARHAKLDAASVEEDDAALWVAQRELQRAPDGAVLKVSGLTSDLPLVIAAARDAGASVVSRAALGLSWIAFPPADDLAARVATTARRLAPRACAVLDGSAAIAGGASTGSAAAPSSTGADEPPLVGAAALMHNVKRRFDPAGLFPDLSFGGL